MENKVNDSGMPGLSWTYEGPLGILDNDTIFRNEIASYDDYYELLLNQNGSRNIPDRKTLLKKIKNIENIVQLRVFCYEFKKSYVGNNGNSAAQTTATIQNCGSRLRSVK